MEYEPIQQPIQSSPYQSPMNNFGSSILYLTNPENEVFKLELTLRNQIQDKDGGIKQLGEPLLNDRGIGIIIGIVQPMVNQITVMSSLDTKKEIFPLILATSDTLIKLLATKYKEFDLNPDYRDYILSSFNNITFICMKRAVSDGLSDKKFWRGSVQEIHQQVEGGKKRGLFDKLFNRAG